MLGPWTVAQATTALVASLALLSPIGGAVAAAAAEADDYSSNRISNDSLVWGPFRPNVYFGVRPRIPKSLLTGLMWTNVGDFMNAQKNIRHTCESDEGMKGYGWDEYDVRNGGRQTINDVENNITITTEFVKVPGGSHGGSWGVRINGALREGAPADTKTTVIFYVANTGDGTLAVTNEQDTRGYEGLITIQGNTQGLGSFQFDVTRGPSTNRHPRNSHPMYEDKPLDRTFVQSVRVADNVVWEAKKILFQQIKLDIDLAVEKIGKENPPPAAQAFSFSNSGTRENANYHMVQKVFEGSFEFDILYSSASADEAMTSEDISNRIRENKRSFAKRYSEVFQAQKPFNTPKYEVFSKALFSNLLGGIGYFHGDQIIDRSGAEEYAEDDELFWETAAAARAKNKGQLEGPYELFTAIPSRGSYPRGFLWDEGFHLLPIIDWDTGLTVEIVRSWFNLIDEDGWIARELILGDEARTKVPPEFRTQYPHYANPPTLFLIVDLLANKLASHELTPVEKQSYSDVVKEVYPLLKRNYFWYRKSQAGDMKSYDREAYSSKEGYRWRGRTQGHILTSGLDDYPRALPPHPGELHVDLLSWVGLMAHSLTRIASALEEHDDVKEFAGYENAILRNMDDLHWSEEHQTFCDSTIDEEEEPVHVCHKGYVSLFPFITGLLPSDSPRLGPVLDLIADPEELWSNYGIRSLSKKDKFYGTAEDYWRGPIWMNINYLVLNNLLRVAQVPESPHQAKATDMYNKLRKNLVKTVYDSWKTTGVVWEEYNPETGVGQRTQQFTGWTSLVVKIMCMPDLSKVGPGMKHEDL